MTYLTRGPRMQSTFNYGQENNLHCFVAKRRFQMILFLQCSYFFMATHCRALPIDGAQQMLRKIILRSSLSNQPASGKKLIAYDFFLRHGEQIYSFENRKTKHTECQYSGLVIKSSSTHPSICNYLPEPSGLLHDIILI